MASFQRSLPKGVWIENPVRSFEKKGLVRITTRFDNTDKYKYDKKVTKMIEKHQVQQGPGPIIPNKKNNLAYFLVSVLHFNWAFIFSFNFKLFIPCLRD